MARKLIDEKRIDNSEAYYTKSRGGYIRVSYTLNDVPRVSTWDASVDIAYLETSLKNMGATNVLIGYF